MDVCVFGLWHLGCVTAACLANAGHTVVGLDRDEALVKGLNAGRAPLFEPGLDELLNTGLKSGNLRFTSDVADATRSAGIFWIAFDTPVDDDDRADVKSVIAAVRSLFDDLPDKALVLLSSQVPVGTTRALAADHRAGGSARQVRFGYSPENLRLGKAIEAFTRPDRVIVGLESDEDAERMRLLLSPFTDQIVFMGIESAEMTKHAINAFLATSVVFANEIAEICEHVGADAKEVELGLKSERRIGPKAYLSPGAAFAGGTLARDVNFLSGLGREFGLPIELIPSLRRSNDWHRTWSLRILQRELETLDGKQVALLGLTYKAGTSTLRRSSAVELGMALADFGATVVAFDSQIDHLPPELNDAIMLGGSVESVLAGASAAVIGTDWPALREVQWPAALARMTRPLILDANWFLAVTLSPLSDVEYHAVGLSRSGGAPRKDP